MFTLLLLSCAHDPQFRELEQDKFALQAGFREIRQDLRVTGDLARLYHEGQWDRQHAVDPRALAIRDAERVTAVRRYVDANRVSSLPDHLHAAAVLYRGTHSDDYQLAWELARAASAAGFRPARAVAAAAWDRLLVSRGGLQDYGTELLETGEGLKLVAVSGTLDDDERARWDVPPLADTIQAVLDANGAAGPANLETLAYLGLLADPRDGPAPAEAPVLERCADFEGLGGASPGEAYAGIGIHFEGASRTAAELDGDRPDGAGLIVEAGQALVAHFDPPIILFRFDAVGVAGLLNITAYAGEAPIYPASNLVLEASSEGWEPGGRAFVSGVPRLADRLVIRSATEGDTWAIDDLCVGP